MTGSIEKQTTVGEMMDDDSRNGTEAVQILIHAGVRAAPAFPQMTLQEACDMVGVDPDKVVTAVQAYLRMAEEARK